MRPYWATWVRHAARWGGVHAGEREGEASEV